MVRIDHHDESEVRSRLRSRQDALANYTLLGNSFRYSHIMNAAERQLPFLRTERLVLRAPNEEDIPAWFARATDSEAASLAGDPVPDHIAAGDEWLARSRHQTATGSRLQWSIDRPGVTNSIGTVSLSIPTPAIGFVLGRAHWGQGLATEAAQEVLRHAFNSLGLPEVSAEAASRNKASLRVIAKLGFRHVGTFTDDLDGEMCEQFILQAPRG
jgi:ribosomal-protein-alanine N-acetyltransferase